jgi:HicB-like protein involved in pilus formation
MDLTPYVTSVEESLAAAAAAGDEATRHTADALAAALEPATRLAIMNALSELALEVTEALDDRVVELRLEAGEVRPAVTPAAGEEAAFRDTGEAGGESSRITLRLPEALKARAERTAAAEGVSLNTWLNGAVQARLRDGDRRRSERGNRVRGWVQG